MMSFNGIRFFSRESQILADRAMLSMVAETKKMLLYISGQFWTTRTS